MWEWQKKWIHGKDLYFYLLPELFYSFHWYGLCLTGLLYYENCVRNGKYVQISCILYAAYVFDRSFSHPRSEKSRNLIKPKYFTKNVLKIDAFGDFWALVKCVNLWDMTVLRKIIFRIVQKEETVEYYTNYNYKTGSQKAIAVIRQAKV